MSALGTFVYYRTYSRWLPELGRRETWRETVRRASEYNVGLAVKHTQDIGYPVDYEWHRKEAELLFDNMFHLRQFLSGRTLWTGGTDVADKYVLSNFNCSFLNIRSWSDFGDLFYMLMVGTGVGFKCTKEMARNLPPIRTNTALIHSDYEPVPKVARYESTVLRDMDNGYAKIYVGDSKEGWTDALRVYLDILTLPTYEHIHTVKVSYNSVRPNGERLRTFGGTASGHEPLREMFTGIDAVLKGAIDPSLEPLEDVMVPYYHEVTGLTLSEAHPQWYQRVRPIHVLDIGNLIGANVVVGGVRRTAEIFLCDADDYECIFAKYGLNGIWDADKHADVIAKTRALGLEKEAQFLEGLALNDANVRPLHHRRMSNNSIAFETQPSREQLNLVFTMMQAEGEPGFVNLEEARRRRPNAEGLNPCFTGDMRLLTADGYRRFDELDGQDVSVINKDGKATSGKVWCSGEKEVVEIRTANRKLITATPDHVFMANDGSEVEAQHLKGKRVMPFLMKPQYADTEYVLLGFAQGDGNLTRLNSTSHKGIEINVGVRDEEVRALFKERYSLTESARVIYVSGMNTKLEELGFDARILPERIFPTTYDSWTHEQKKAFLCGCYSANGCVINTGRIQYKTTCRAFADKVVDTLESDFGINSYITTNKSREQEFKNGTYTLRESYDINIGRYEDRVTFYNTIGFVHGYKSAKLKRRLLDSAPMVTSVTKRNGTEKVYDFTEPETHWGVVEGVVVHNCAEILLDSYGVCNLTTVNMTAFVRNGALDYDALHEAQRLSARAGLRMTLATLELPHWNAIQQRDRLLGTSLTGVKDALASANIGVGDEALLLTHLGGDARNEADAYAKKLRVSAPLLVTTVKPEGTISQVAGGVSSGLHYSHSPYYIRRIRISAFDPLASAVIALGWRINPEVGTQGKTYEERMANARTYVIDFPVKSGATRTKDDVSAAEQLDTYFAFQRYYTEHNSSNTITVRPHEWAEVERIVYDKWDDFTAVSFLALDGGSYELAPYEAITAEEYEFISANMLPFDTALLERYETDGESDLDGADGCEGGVCPIR